MDIHEAVIKKLHPHPFGFLLFYITGTVIFIFGFLVYWPLYFLGLFTIILGEISRRAETFFILEGGVVREYRLLATSRDFAEYAKIQNIEVRQSFIENMLGIGSVRIDTAGGDHTEVNFSSIRDPYGIEHIIRDKMKMH